MKVKRFILSVVAVLASVFTYAASPNLQDITLTNNGGETLDFYANRSNTVVYMAPGASQSRTGTFYLGSTISSANGNVEARFSIELPMSYGMKELSGTIYYNYSSGRVYSVTLNGSTYRSSSRTVAPRRR